MPNPGMTKEQAEERILTAAHIRIMELEAIQNAR